MSVLDKAPAAYPSSPKPKRTPLAKEIMKNKWLYIMLIPAIIYYIIFKFVPASYIAIVFQDYYPTLGMSGSPWVGFQNFTRLFTDTAVYSFKLLFKNTVILAVYNIVFYFPVPIILALALNEIRAFTYKRVLQSFVYLPHFLSWSVLVGLVYLFIGPTGYINKVLIAAGGKAAQFLLNPAWFRPLIVLEVIWKEAGWGTIIYLAALSNVDEQLYEAAVVDGAGRFRQLWNITLPSIRSTIITLLILRMGTFMDTGFEQIYLMRNAINRQVAEVFDTYVYVEGIQNGNYSYSTTVGLFKSIISLIMVLGTNKIASLFGEEGVF